MMQYKHLERIQRLMSTKSTSEFGVGQSTSLIKRNFEDGSGALARIKAECDNAVQYAASAYCIDCKTSYLRLRFLLHAKMIEWFKRDGRSDMSKTLPLVDIAMCQVFKGQHKTLEQCGKALGMTKTAYSKTWQVYVDDAYDILIKLLFRANITAGDYFYAEMIDEITNKMV